MSKMLGECSGWRDGFPLDCYDYKSTCGGNNFLKVNNYFAECINCYSCGYRKYDNGEVGALPNTPYCNGQFTENF